jgi:hypothetical protein
VCLHHHSWFFTISQQETGHPGSSSSRTTKLPENQHQQRTLWFWHYGNICTARWTQRSYSVLVLVVVELPFVQQLPVLVLYDCCCEEGKRMSVWGLAGGEGVIVARRPFQHLVSRRFHPWSGILDRGDGRTTATTLTSGCPSHCTVFAWLPLTLVIRYCKSCSQEACRLLRTTCTETASVHLRFTTSIDSMPHRIDEEHRRRYR